MRTAVIAATLIAASSVSSAPIPLRQDGPQADFALESRDGLGLSSAMKSIKNVFSKKEPAQPDPIFKALGSEEDSNLLSTSGRHDELAEKAKVTKPSLLMEPSLDPTTGAPLGPPVQKERFRDSQWAKDELWKWKPVKLDDPASVERMINSKHTKTVDGTTYMSDGRISKLKATEQTALVGGVVATGVTLVGGVGYLGYLGLKPRPTRMERFCRKHPQESVCNKGQLIR